MKPRAWGLLLSIALIATSAAAFTIHAHRRAVFRSEVLQAYDATNTALAYVVHSDFSQADLAAREKLGRLSAEDLNDSDRETVECVADLLASIEELHNAGLDGLDGTSGANLAKSGERAQRCVNAVH